MNWVEVGGAMEKLASDPPHYWAPEVTYSDGKFYLYYSAGNEALMEIRVAVSDRPDGGFVDSGKRLTHEEFAIDAHVFTDTDGSLHFFYATDFLEHTHIGTGVVVDKMIDWFTLAGDPRPVTRAKFDWQVYDPARVEKGGVRWHTVEGPFVIKRKGVYYQMFSGGNWQNTSYGVGFATTGDIESETEWKQFSDGVGTLPILRTIPNQVIGPGHNSVIAGPNNRELFCVYHEWIQGERVLAVDRMDFAGSRIFVLGATNTPQPLPYLPYYCGFEDPAIVLQGGWEISEKIATSKLPGESELIFPNAGGHFLAVFDVEIARLSETDGTCGFSLAAGGETPFELQLSIEHGRTCIRWGSRINGELSDSFYASTDIALLNLRLDVNGRNITVDVNGSLLQIESLLPSAPSRFALTASSEATFSGFALTRGFEDLFNRPRESVEGYGWEVIRGGGSCEIRDREFIVDGRAGAISIAKGPFYEEYEIAVNIRVSENGAAEAVCGFEIDCGQGERLKVNISGRTIRSEAFVFELPESFDPANYHQFRLIVRKGTVKMQMEGLEVGTFAGPDGPSRTNIFCEKSVIALDMVRLTDLTIDSASRSV